MSGSRLVPRCDEFDPLVVIDSVQERIQLVTWYTENITNILFDETALENFTASQTAHTD
jgi:hypothetical protein